MGQAREKFELYSVKNGDGIVGLKWRDVETDKLEVDLVSPE